MTTAPGGAPPRRPIDEAHWWRPCYCPACNSGHWCCTKCGRSTEEWEQIDYCPRPAPVSVEEVIRDAIEARAKREVIDLDLRRGRSR